jgi:predicted HTH transcriptional regulator
MARLMREARLAPPRMAVRAGAVVLTFDLPLGMTGKTPEKMPKKMPEKTPEKMPKKMPKKTPEKTPEKMPKKTPEKTPDLILALLRETSALSMSELALRLNKSASAVERAIRKLRESGRLARVGPDKGGHWQVLPDKDKPGGQV